MRPYVVLHSAVSLDGRITGFDPDLATFYGLAARWKEDVTLAGCDTLLAATSGEDAADETTADESPAGPNKEGPLLVVPDSRGRLRSWAVLLKAPFWRGGLALVCDSTPDEYMEYLETVSVPHLRIGGTRVDLARALEALHERYEARTVRVDAGGKLNGALLRAGLADEVSVLVHPVLAGGCTARTAFSPADDAGERTNLQLTHLVRLDGGLVWLRYTTDGSGQA